MTTKTNSSDIRSKMVSSKWISYWAALWTFGFLLTIVKGDLTKTCTLDHRVGSSPGICGEQLSEFLHWLCVAYNKRSGPEASAILDDEGSNQKQVGFTLDSLIDNNIFINKEQALSYLRWNEKRNYRTSDPYGAGHGYRGIVCECCHHQCSILEMKQYCAVASATFSLTNMGKRSAYMSSKNPSISSALSDLERLWTGERLSKISEENNLFTGEHRTKPPSANKRSDLRHHTMDDRFFKGFTKSDSSDY